jgi:pSer/pThr/pTyr-binding forkhead associated (FHA) protein
MAKTIISMRIRYTKPDGESVMYDLGEKPLTAGRSPEADICVFDERASRVHCGLRLWDGEFYLKDLKSKNGTFLNDKAIDVSKIRGGDIIRIGNTLLMVEDGEQMGTNTAMAHVRGEMDGGKGYSTLLRQIVSDVPGKGTADAPSVPVNQPREESQHLGTGGDHSESKKLGTGPIKVGMQKKPPVRITIRRPPSGL